MKCICPLIQACLLAATTTGICAATFKDVEKHIDTDGQLLAFLDFEGDGKEIADQLNAIYQDALENFPMTPPIPVDFNQVFDTLGFGSLRSVAASSKELENGLHVNRSVALMNGEPAGLFGIYSDEGLQPKGFTAAQLAPVDANFAACGPINLKPISDTYLTMMTQIMGPKGEGIVKGQLAMPVPGTELTIEEIISNLSSYWDVAYKIDMSDPENPDIKFWAIIEDAAKTLEKLKPIGQMMPVVFTETEDGLVADFSALMTDTPFGLFIKTQPNGHLIIYTDPTWTATTEGARLADSPEFQALTKNLPEKALWYSYSGGFDLISVLQEEMAADPMTAAYAGVIEKVYNLTFGDFYKPSAYASYYEGDALLTVQYASFSYKQAVMMVPTSIGVMYGGITAAMAVPAFQKVRETSQEKTVMNNLRMIASAADQYFLEEGKTEVKIEDLIGEGKYIRSLEPVAGESYEGMIIKVGEPIRVTLGNGEVIEIDF